MAIRGSTRSPGGAQPLATVRRGLPAGVVLAAAGLCPLLHLASVRGQEPSVELGEVIGGWRVLHEKGCAYCHAVSGQGGQIGPDLGRTYRGHLNASELAGAMWNHVPRMLALMRQYELPEVSVTRAEMADLLSLLYFVRYLDEAGDPREGARILQEKKCAECHLLEREGGTIGPDLLRWAGYVNPIVWAQMMWEHGAGMEKAMEQANIPWPELDDDDLGNIIAFVRSVGPSAPKVYLRPGSSAQGRRLFQERKCALCHSPDSDPRHKGPDLAHIHLPHSLSALASSMWNHLPAMRKLMAEQGVEVPALTAQEMADVIAYLFAQQYEGEPGDATRGQRIFVQNRCGHCHTFYSPSEGAAAGPESVVGLGHAAWQHGARMVEQMTLAGISWPTFEGTEMADLIAYINSAGRLAAKPELAGPAGPGPVDDRGRK